MTRTSGANSKASWPTRLRIARLDSDQAWAEVPPSRTLRMVGILLVEPTDRPDVRNVACDRAKEQAEKESRGQPGDFQFSCAYGFAGETLVELARHDGGRSIYKDWIDDKGYRLHPIGFRQMDGEEYRKAERHYSTWASRSASG